MAEYSSPYPPFDDFDAETKYPVKEGSEEFYGLRPVGGFFTLGSGYEEKFAADFAGLDSVRHPRFGIKGNGVANDAAAFAALPAGTYIVPPGNYRLASVVSIPSGVNLVFRRGAVFQPAVAVTIGGWIEAGQYTIFDYSLGGSIVFAATRRARTALIDWFGATNDKLTDCSTPFNRILAAMPEGKGSVIRFGEGDYLFTAGNLDRISTTKIIQIRGEGTHSTNLWFNPIVLGKTLFTFEPILMESLVYNCVITQLSIYKDSEPSATIIKAYSVRNFAISSVRIFVSHPDDAETIALDIGGRDESHIYDTDIYAPRPLYFRKSPWSAVSSVDHWNFHNVVLYSVIGPSTHALMECESGVHFSSVHFTGKQVWVGGNGAVLFDNSAAVANGGFASVSFTNFRWEAGGKVQTRPAITIKARAGSGGTLKISDFYIGVHAGNVTGILVRNIFNVSLENGEMAGTVGGLKSYDVDSTVRSLWVMQVLQASAVQPVLTGMKKVLGFGQMSSSSSEPFKYFVPSSFPLVFQYFSFGDHQMWSSKFTLNDAAFEVIPPSSGALGFARVFVTAEAGTGSQEWGEWILTEDTPNMSSILAVGSANAAITTTAGKLSVYRVSGNDTIRVHNNLGSQRKISVMVFFARAVDLL